MHNLQSNKIHVEMNQRISIKLTIN